MSTEERVLTARMVSFVNFIANASTPRELGSRYISPAV